jgi:cytochrome c556
MKIKNVIFYISFLLISSIVSLTPLLANEDAKGVVKERMDNFKMSKKMMQTIHKSIQNEDFVTIEKSATTLHNWSKGMIKYFPEGSDGAPSEASADIWLDPDGFKKAVNNFELASLKLINNSKEKDFDKTVDSFRSLAGTCKGCHQKFRN